VIATHCYTLLPTSCYLLVIATYCPTTLLPAIYFGLRPTPAGGPHFLDERSHAGNMYCDEERRPSVARPSRLWRIQPVVLRSLTLDAPMPDAHASNLPRPTLALFFGTDAQLFPQQVACTRLTSNENGARFNVDVTAATWNRAP